MRQLAFPLFGILAAAMLGCEARMPNTPAAKKAMHDEAMLVLEKMEVNDPDLQPLVDKSYGYVVFPEIGEAAIGFGGAAGTGIVYKQGQRVGTVRMKQGSVGVQLSGQTYSELILFEDDKAFGDLTHDAFQFGGDVGAAFVKRGAAKGKNFAAGVQIYILPRGGLKAGVALNGQRFRFTPDQVGPVVPSATPAIEINPSEPATTKPAATEPSAATTTESAPDAQAAQQAMREEAHVAVRKMEAQDADLQQQIDKSYGYVIFPEIGAAAIGIGGASGMGIVYKKDQIAGVARVNQASIGVQLSSAAFSELVLFEDARTFGDLTHGTFHFAPDAAATFVRPGAAKGRNFTSGTQVYVLPKGGLTSSVALDGQKFGFAPDQATSAAPTTTSTNESK